MLATSGMGDLQFKVKLRITYFCHASITVNVDYCSSHVIIAIQT